ncbi:MAG: WbqC family protein [Cyclobacteriaceae bacterium]
MTLIEIQFLPSLEYFCCLLKHPVTLDRHEHFVKQTYRNRCYINSANKVIPLVVPIKSGSRRLPMAEVPIDYRQKWLNSLWSSIQSAYGKSPFYEFYEEEFHSVLFSKPDFLFDLNFKLLTLCLRCLQINLELKLSTGYHLTEDRGLNDLRSKIHPKKPFGDRNFYRPYSYTQLFGNNFVPNLSLIDLIFCEGPNAGAILRKSMFQPE